MRRCKPTAGKDNQLMHLILALELYSAAALLPGGEGDERIDTELTSDGRALNRDART